MNQLTITAEVRCFVLDQHLLDAALYEGSASLADAKAFANSLLQSMPLPRSIVLDLGFVADRGWLAIEFNSAWGAGLNGCSPEKVLPAIAAASAP